MGDEFLTIKEVCAIIKASHNHVYTMIRHGLFPRQIKIGNSSRWRRSELEAWMNRLSAQGGQ